MSSTPCRRRREDTNHVRAWGKPALLVCLGLVLYLIATTSGAGWLYVVASGVVGVVLVSAAAPLWNARGVEVERKAPAVGTAGEPLACEMQVRNVGRFARHLMEVRDGFAGGAGAGVVARVGRGATEVFGYEIEVPSRGMYDGGEVVVESSAPFGLFRGRWRRWVSSATTVYPRTFEVAGLPRPATDDAGGAEREEASEMHRGLGGEFWGVREYRPGDPARLIAWRQSARSLASGRLSVVELAQETAPPLSLALDLDPRAPSAVREMAVSATASIVLRALGKGRAVLADAGPQRAAFPEAPDPDAVLAWCAGLEPATPPEAGGAGIAIVPTLKRDRLPAAATVVLVSCHEFAGAGPWMTPEEERTFVEGIEASGRTAAVLGPDVREPWGFS